MKTQIQYLRKLEYYLRPIQRKDFLEILPTEKYEHEKYEHVQHSILSGAPFA